MGKLHDFNDYIENRLRLVRSTKNRLLDLLTHYENFFQEVSSVREHEFAQLVAEISRRKGALPHQLDEILEQTRAQAEADMDAQLAALLEQHSALVNEAEQLRQNSMSLEAEAHSRHVDLDAKEEALKARNEQLLQGITAYNAKIRELGTGFGFLFNLFEMRGLRKERLRLDDEHGNVAARIEAIRSEWVNREAEYARRQQDLQTEWLELTTQAAALQAKVDHLRLTRVAVVERTSLERILFEKYKVQTQEGKDKQCPRCGAGNAAGNSFCQVCALRLQADRPDLEGSLWEIAELNHHHHRFSQGMKASQEIIGLVTGLESGLKAFKKSVTSMIENERRYPLPKLQIDVPASSVEYGRSFEQLASRVEQEGLLPAEFAKMVEEATVHFGADRLEAYFEGMGNELSVQAKAQWG